MQWGLFSESSPDWFKNVEICFTYIPVHESEKIGDIMLVCASQNFFQLLKIQ
jgi:hypothetical protein